MACGFKYFNIAAAGLTGVGSGISIVVGAGTPVSVGGILGAIGSLCWLISALNDLIECLQRNGKKAEAERLLEHVKNLEREVDRLKKLVA